MVSGTHKISEIERLNQVKDVNEYVIYSKRSPFFSPCFSFLRLWKGMLMINQILLYPQQNCRDPQPAEKDEEDNIDNKK